KLRFVTFKCIQDGFTSALSFQDLLDVIQREFQRFQLGDRASGLNLIYVVVPIAGVTIDSPGRQQPFLMVEAEGLDRQSSNFREFANAEHDRLNGHCLGNDGIVRPPPAGESRQKMRARKSGRYSLLDPLGSFAGLNEASSRGAGNLKKRLCAD